MDVLGECRHALAWIDAHAPKTARGMPVFLVGWLGRAKKDASVAPKLAYGWNHDRLPGPSNVVKGPDPAADRRKELWNEELAAGKSEVDAKRISYERWVAEKASKR